jgi:hypothetical protein
VWLGYPGHVAFSLYQGSVLLISILMVHLVLLSIYMGVKYETAVAYW